MIYIHIPFCHRKCTYCAFYSAVTQADKDRYVESLCAEIGQRSLFFGAERHAPKTIYFGGGTPSLLTSRQLGRIVEALRTCFDFSQLEEVTLEANPEDLTPRYLAELRGLRFFNRLSLGVQSFSDADLRLLNRRHDAQQALDAIRLASQAGFDNISIDLIYGLPRQSLADWRRNLEPLEALPITHLSAYSLTIEEGTMLSRQVEQGRVQAAADEQVLSHYEALLEWCAVHGFEQYEVSNFCRPGGHSRHNSRYWNRTPYLGLGAAAHSFDGRCRRWNVADYRQYQAGIEGQGTYFESEALSPADAHNEYLMTALRTPRGIEKGALSPLYRKELDVRIRKYVANRLIEETLEAYRPTPQGLLHADGIAADLFV